MATLEVRAHSGAFGSGGGTEDPANGELRWLCKERIATPARTGGALGALCTYCTTRLRLRASRHR